MLTAAGSRRGLLAARCSRRISLRLGLAWEGPHGDSPMQSAAESPAGRRVTARLAGRQVRRPHRIKVTRVSANRAGTDGLPPRGRLGPHAAPQSLAAQSQAAVPPAAVPPAAVPPAVLPRAALPPLAAR